MGVYVTGDTHGDCTRIIEYARSHFLDAHDTVIVAGDFGCVWKGSPEENRRLDHLSESLDCRLAFVSGNHENFDILNNKSFYLLLRYGQEVMYNTSEKYHRFSLRGEMFCIDGKRIFTFGGARSTDISDGLLQEEETKKLSGKGFGS